MPGVEPATGAGRISGGLLLLFVYFLTAAAAFNAYYTRYGFRENLPLYSLPAMVDGTAQRPFVYRQLLPSLANGIESALPPAWRQSLAAQLSRPSHDLPLQMTRSGLRHGDADDPRYAFRYHLIYALDFLSLFAALFFMRAASREIGVSRVAANAAPCLFAIAFPLLLSKGGYIYDLPEVLFLFAATWLALLRRTWLWLLVPIAALATFNKESFIFFVIALLPLIATGRRDWRGLAVIGAALLASAATHLAVRHAFHGNPGSTTYFQLMQNVRYYLNPLNLLSIDRVDGIVMFAGYSFITLWALGIVIMRARARLPAAVRRHALWAAAINLPLLLLFCEGGETRNLSLLYPSLVLAIAAAIDSSIAADPGSVRARGQARA